MAALRLAVAAIWVAFWVYWLAAARGTKPSTPGVSGWPFRLFLMVAVVLVLRVGLGALSRRGHTGQVNSLALGVLGVLVLLAGLGLAVWARVHLGRNWGMPMSQRNEPELVTDGPYRLVRHPIYTGLVLGAVGTSLAVNLLGLVVSAVVLGYFYGAAKVEERNLVVSLPSYRAYRDRTKMMIPYLL